VERGRGKCPKWEVPEKKKWEVHEVGSARKKKGEVTEVGRARKKNGKRLLWEVTVGMGVHPGKTGQ